MGANRSIFVYKIDKTIDMYKDSELLCNVKLVGEKPTYQSFGLTRTEAEALHKQLGAVLGK